MKQNSEDFNEAEERTGHVYSQSCNDRLFRPTRSAPRFWMTPRWVCQLYQFLPPLSELQRRRTAASGGHDGVLFTSGLVSGAPSPPGKARSVKQT